MNLHKDLPLWADKEKGIVNCIIEINMGSMTKYEFNKEYNVVEVDRFFTAPMPLPYNYGTLPQTHNEGDGDPLDIILVSTYGIVPGAISKAKVIGVLHMIDGGESDDKIIAIPYKDPFLWEIDSLDTLPAVYKNQIEYFLSNYKKLEKKETEVTGWDNKSIAIDIITQCEEDYKKM